MESWVWITIGHLNDGWWLAWGPPVTQGGLGLTVLNGWDLVALDIGCLSTLTAKLSRLTCYQRWKREKGDISNGYHIFCKLQKSRFHLWPITSTGCWHVTTCSRGYSTSWHVSAEAEDWEILWGCKGLLIPRTISNSWPLIYVNKVDTASDITLPMPGSRECSRSGGYSTSWHVSAEDGEILHGSNHTGNSRKLTAVVQHGKFYF